MENINSKMTTQERDLTLNANIDNIKRESEFGDFLKVKRNNFAQPREENKQEMFGP